MDEAHLASPKGPLNFGYYWVLQQQHIAKLHLMEPIMARIMDP